MGGPIQAHLERTMKSAAAAEPVCPRTGRGLQLAPVLRASNAQIRELGARRGTSLAHIKSVVEGDPALALNLFAEVNADLRRAGHAPVGDIPRAILFMGMADAPGRLTRASVLEDSVEPDLAGELIRMLCRAHHASRQARTIGALAGGLNGDELLAASLTREGLPYLQRLAAGTGDKLNPAACDAFLPALPDSHDAASTTMKCLDLAARFADITAHTWDAIALDELYLEIGDFTGRDPDHVARSLCRTTVEAARAASHYPSYTPALRLMSPGGTAPATKPATPTPAPVVRVETAKKPAPAKRKPTRRMATQATAVRTGETVVAQQAPQPVNDVLARIARASAAGESAAALLPLALQGICATTGMRLAVLLMRDKASPELWLRAYRGLELPAAFRQRAIPLDGNPLFAKLLAKPAAFQWLPDKHAHTLAGMPLKLLGGKPAFLYSLHVNAQPLGILLGCRPDAAAGAPGAGFAAFKQIVVATRDGLQQARNAAAPPRTAP